MHIRLLPLYLLIVLSIGLSAQTADSDLKKIEGLLASQAEHWNAGDLEAFVQTYWQSDSLLFGGASGLTYGWQATLDGYKRRYPDRKAMGKLTFQVVDLRKLGEDRAMLTGSWDLERESDNRGGYFLLIWQKFNGKWKIIADHTSARCP
jgi:ketosteroid isomerase-like protein